MRQMEQTWVNFEAEEAPEGRGGFRLLDPAQEDMAERRWPSCLRWFKITDGILLCRSQMCRGRSLGTIEPLTPLTLLSS